MGNHEEQSLNEDTRQACGQSQAPANAGGANGRAPRYKRAAGVLGADPATACQCDQGDTGFSERGFLMAPGARDDAQSKGT